jgi:hypothetical protein
VIRKVSFRPGGPRREGKRHIYAVDDPHVVTLVEQIFDHIAPDGTPAPDPQPAVL